jgi:malonyl-ACP decarboxylase
MRTRIVITGIGVRTSNALGVTEFDHALRNGISGVGQIPFRGGSIPGAPLKDGSWAEDLSGSPVARRILTSAPLSTQVGCVVAVEALRNAGLEQDCASLALIVAGNNIHQQYQHQHYERFRERPEYINPRYAVSFPDTSLLAAVSEICGLRGPGFTVGGSMASGNVALYQAVQLLRAGAVQACLCVGALADWGDIELQSLLNLGALNNAPLAGVPFDKGHTGFVFGQGSGAVVLETAEHAAARCAHCVGELAGVSLVLDGHSGSEPNDEGEALAMLRAVEDAGVDPSQVDYVNAHGTGTPTGDSTECRALERVFSGPLRPRVNSTKSLIGHTICAAGIVEAIACLLQMNGRYIHPQPGLKDPVSGRIRFAGSFAEGCEIGVCLSNSFSIGGINSSILLRSSGDLQ